MTPFQLQAEVKRRKSLFGYSYQSRIRAEPRNHVPRNGPPFVQYELCFHSLLLEMLGNDPGSLQSTDLLVVSKGDEVGSFGLKTCLQKPLNGLHKTDDSNFIVNGSASPNGIANNIASKGVFFPVLPVLIDDGHNIVVPHENCRL